jgi:hypothetical protein
MLCEFRRCQFCVSQATVCSAPMACTRSLARNETTDFSAVLWHTKQIGRVVRSTLSAEAYSMSSSLDKLTWIRTMWGYIKSPDFDWSKPELSLKREPKGLMITDCKSLYHLITKNAVPNCQEWRTTIEVMLLKEQSRDHTTCRWVSSSLRLPTAWPNLRTPRSCGRCYNLVRFTIE